MSATQTSWSEMFQNIVSNIQEIVRSEVRLAKAEIKEETQAAARACVSLGIGAVLGLYAAGFILLGLVYALSLAMPNWLAALLVGIPLAGGACFLISSGWKKLKQVQPKPVRTIESVKETVQWAKNQQRS